MNFKVLAVGVSGTPILDALLDKRMQELMQQQIETPTINTQPVLNDLPEYIVLNESPKLIKYKKNKKRKKHRKQFHKKNKN